MVFSSKLILTGFIVNLQSSIGVRLSVVRMLVEPAELLVFDASLSCEIDTRMDEALRLYFKLNRESIPMNLRVVNPSPYAAPIACPYSTARASSILRKPGLLM